MRFFLYVRNPLTQFADFSDGTQVSMNDQIQDLLG